MNYTGCRPLSEDEIVRLLDACQGRYRARDVAIIMMGMHTGFRISELLSLRVKDVWNGSEVAKDVKVEKGFMKGKKKGAGQKSSIMQREGACRSQRRVS